MSGVATGGEVSTSVEVGGVVGGVGTVAMGGALAPGNGRGTAPVVAQAAVAATSRRPRTGCRYTAVIVAS
jgi:hypothetical protein